MRVLVFIYETYFNVGCAKPHAKAWAEARKQVRFLLFEAAYHGRFRCRFCDV